LGLGKLPHDHEQEEHIKCPNKSKNERVRDIQVRLASYLSSLSYLLPEVPKMAKNARYENKNRPNRA